MDDDLLNPKQATKLLGVTIQTLVNWERSGTLASVRTNGGHRRYRRADILARGRASQTSTEPPATVNTQKKRIAYCRVSSPSQRQDLERQIEFFRNRYPHHEIISDIGSGINFKRKGFNSLLDQAIRGNIEELVVTHRDRLCRFGFEFFERIIQQYSNGKIVVLYQDETSPEKELVGDLLSIITVFSSRLYGLRSHKLKKEIKEQASRTGPGTTTQA